MDRKELLRKEFEKIRKREPLTPEAVVKEGVKKKSVLYPFFSDILENKEKVIRLALEQRARQLINYVSIEIVYGNGTRDVPLYESITVETNGTQLRQYEPITSISENPEYRMQILDTTKSWIETMQEKLGRFREFLPIVESLENVKISITQLKHGK